MGCGVCAEVAVEVSHAGIVLGKVVLCGPIALCEDAANHVALRTTDHTCPLAVAPAARDGSTHCWARYVVVLVAHRPSLAFCEG